MAELTALMAEFTVFIWRKINGRKRRENEGRTGKRRGCRSREKKGLKGRSVPEV